MFEDKIQGMDNNDSNAATCDGIITANEVTIIKGVFGGLGAITCTVGLVFVIVSKFYKDIVQRLILYKLIAMLIFSLSQFMLSRYDDSIIYKGVTVLIPHIVYCANLILTFWLTIVLHLCIVHLKELRNLKKVEPIAIITSCLPLAIAAFISIANFDTCKQTVYITSTIGEEKYAFIIWYSIVVVLCFIISILVVMIFIVTIRRSQIRLQRQDDSEAESLLVTNNKWKILSKQLLPLAPLLCVGGA